MNGHLDACEMLIKLGASIELGNLSEKTLLQYAIESQCQKVISFFTALENQRTKYSLYMAQTPTWTNANELNSSLPVYMTPKNSEKNTNVKKQSTLMSSVITGNKKLNDYESRPAKRSRTVGASLENNETVIFY